MKLIKSFLPLAILYIIITIVFSKPELIGDESRYVHYAMNLSNGFYAGLDKGIVNGPGYPVILVPFVMLKAPLIFPKLLNSIFIVLALLYFYKILLFYIDTKTAIKVTYILGCFPLTFLSLPQLYSEAFAFFLLNGFIYYSIRLLSVDLTSKKELFLSALFLSLLALTRTIFGVIIVICLLLMLMIYIIWKNSLIRKSIYVFIISFIFCMPYLVYTYSITGKVFYWSSNEGDNLYWLSTPYQGEYGDWYSTKDVLSVNVINKEHRKFYTGLQKLNAVQQDEKYLAKSIENIYNNPIKFVQNWVANVGRLLFNYPYTYDPSNNSYDRQKITTYFYMIPHMILVILFLFSLYPAFITRKSIPMQIKIIMIIGIIYFAGSTLASAVVRYFFLFQPFLFLWIIYVYKNSLHLEIRR